MQDMQDGRETGHETGHDTGAVSNRTRHAATDSALHAERDHNLESELQANAGLEIDPEDLQPKAWVLPDRRRILKVAGVLGTLLLLVLVPPFVSMNRFRRRITQSVSESLGRPVLIDSVSLNMLPLPGFTLENFVVEDDPAFSAEPVIRANSVRVTLRVWSLWRRRVEFSRISLDDPSFNLVRRADGRWNIESILLQAAKMEAAPTAQQGAGDQPRFPYVEASGARVNVKLGLEKMPIALTDADLALWLTEPSLWRLRLEGHPARTNTAASNIGTLRVEGTLGKASSLTEVPVDLTAEWLAAPLGGVSWVLMGRDAGFRGDMNLTASIQGTVGSGKLDTEVKLSDLRRADFVPQHTLDADIHCTAETSATFHQLANLHCGWPSSALSDSTASGLTLSAEAIDLSDLKRASGEATLTAVPASGLLDAARLITPRVSADLTAGGTLSGKLACCSGGQWSVFTGHLAIDKATIALAKGTPFVDTDIAADITGGQLSVGNVALNFGAPQPAMLDLSVDANRVALHLDGPVVRDRLLQLADALPSLGDGMVEVLPPAPAADAADTPVRVDLTSNRTWTTGQVWTAAAAKPVKGHKHLKQR